MDFKRLTISGFLCASLMGLYACEKKAEEDPNGEGSTSVETGEDNGENGENGEGETVEDEVYEAELEVLNSELAGDLEGTVTITVQDGDFIAEVDINGAPADITHAQHIHAGTGCPTDADDANGDGFLDVLEGVPTYGAILIPLDGDLSSQEAGGDDFPTADPMGDYFYSQTASYNDLLDDLNEEDPDPTDATVKLEGEELNLGERHVVIHGVAEDSDLPDTVASLGDLPAEATLPIACGKLTLVEDDDEDNGDDGDNGDNGDNGDEDGPTPDPKPGEQEQQQDQQEQEQQQEQGQNQEDDQEDQDNEED